MQQTALRGAGLFFTGKLRLDTYFGVAIVLDMWAGDANPYILQYFDSFLSPLRKEKKRKYQLFQVWFCIVVIVVEKLILEFV